MLTKNPSGQRGFTLVEMLVVAPLIILLLGAMIAYITTLTGDSLKLREEGDMAYNIQAALDSIEADSIKATKFLDTSGTLPTPQGKNNGTAAFTTTDPTPSDRALVMGTIATDKDPINPSRTPIYYVNQPSPCGPGQEGNTFLITKAIYFVKDGSLWKRTIVPSYNTNSPPDDFTVCSTPWQRNSCSVGQTAAQCRTEDSELVKNISAFTVKYYATSTSTTVLPLADAKKAKSIEVSITTSKSVAGDTVSETGAIRVSRLNDIDANLVAPTVAPVVTSDINNTTSVTFDWAAVPDATSYKVSYSINGGAFNDATITGTSYTINTVRKDNVTFRVTARNSYGTTTTTQASASIPSTVPCDLDSGWEVYGGVYGPTATFTRTSAGVVTLSGLIKKAVAPTQYEVICTLPEGYRPSSRLIFAPATSGTTQGRIDVDTNGDVIYVFGSNAWLSLAGITFLAKDTVTWTNLPGSNGWKAYGDGLTAYAPPQASVDSTGRAHIQGLGSSGTMTAGTLAFTLPSAIPAMDGVDIYAARASAVGTMQINNDKTIRYRGTGGNGYWSPQAMYYPSGTTTWSTPALAASWVKYSTTPGYNTAQYTKNADGVVSLRGLIKSGTATSGTVIFTLPAGYRPSTNIICSQVSSPDSFARVDISSVGQVILREGVSNGWLSLAGCDFLAEQ